jgi:hypothetical protein
VEEFVYGYDKACNLASRTNNALVKSFSVNNVNEITGAGLVGTYTVAGSACAAGVAATPNSSCQ